MLPRINNKLPASCPNRIYISKWVTISKASLRKTIAKASALNSKFLENIFISEKLGSAYFPYYRLSLGEIIKRAKNPRKPNLLVLPRKRELY
jgi:hypothetical protein